MNIFATHDCPVQSALWLDDFRLNKMIVESTQMLSTNVRIVADPLADVYKSSYTNHPCTCWARGSRHNFQWLVDHALAMCVIFSDTRYGRVHGSQHIIQRCATYTDSFMMIGDRHSVFANCTPYKDKDGDDIFTKYRKFMCHKWDNDVIPLSWNNRKKPEWYHGEI